MENLIKILPLALLVIGTAVVVFRGLRRKGDDTDNKARGGGPDPGQHF